VTRVGIGAFLPFQLPCLESPIRPKGLDPCSTAPAILEAIPFAFGSCGLMQIAAKACLAALPCRVRIRVFAAWQGIMPTLTY